MVASHEMRLGRQILFDDLDFAPGQATATIWGGPFGRVEPHSAPTE